MKGGGRKRPPGGLPDKEADLWRRYAETLEPVKRKPRVHAAPAAEPSDAIEARLAERMLGAEARSQGDAGAEGPAPPRTSRRHRVEKPTRPSPALPPAPVQRAKAPPLADFDRRKVRQIASGKVDIDGRIDLHGMTQSEAHGALVAYLHAAYAKGRRVILVITGKGGDNDDGHETLYERMARRGRGVLRRSVPQWLAEPELRAIVSSFTTASVRHGGSGALYVHLRKRPSLDER